MEKTAGVATGNIKKQQRVVMQSEYIEQIISYNATNVINALQSDQLKNLMNTAISRVKGKENEAQILNEMINIQCNEDIGLITQSEIAFLKNRNIKSSTFVNYIQEYRTLLKSKLPEGYKQLQQKYRIKRKQLLAEIRQKNLHVDELEKAMRNVPNNPELQSLNQKMKTMLENDSVLRNIQIALYKMTAGKTVYNQLQQQVHNRQIKKQSELSLVNAQLFVDICRQLLTGRHDERYEPDRHIYIHNIIMGICGLTGRREVEIVKTGKFEYNDEYSLAFEGQAKTRGMKKEAYEIPTLCKAREILNAHTELKTALQKHRLGKPELTNKQVNNLLFTSEDTRTLIRDTFISIYPPDEPPEKISLRSIYAEITFELFQPRMSKKQYFETILGHSNANSAEAYIQNKII